MDEMKQRYGTWEIAWGEVHKVGRGGQYFPAPGADFNSGDKQANFSETLMDVRSVEMPNHPGKYVANSGSMAIILMVFKDNRIESYTCTPWGQSGHPESKHYMDQGQRLYSQRELKPTLWEKSELLKQTESSKTMDYSPP
jgi:acyl-homoserine-lactone acylase